MTIRLPSLKTLALACAGLAITCLLFGWLILPRIIQAQAEKFIAEKTGHHLTMNRPEFNPFELSLHLSGLRLTQPDNEPLLAFQDLVVDLSAASIYRGAFIFDGIRLDGLEATVVLLPNGRLNWSGLIDSLKSKEETSNSPLPKLDIQHFVLAGAKLDFADKRIAPAFTTRIEPLDIELTDISTLPNEKGQYKIYARTTFGASVAWHGETSLDPLAMTGSFSVGDVDLARLSTFFKDSLPVAPPTGKAKLSAEYKLAYSGGHVDLNLEHMTAKVTGLGLHGNGKSVPAITVETIEAKEGRFNLTKNEFALGSLSITGSKLNLQRGKVGTQKALELESLTFEDAHVNLTTHQATLGNIALKGGRVRVTRDAKGRIDLMEALQAASPPTQVKGNKKSKTAHTAAETGWRYRVEKLELSGFAAAFRDESVAPAAELALEDIALGAKGISEDWKIAVPLRASFKAHGGGSFEAEGKITPAEPTADIRLKLTELSLIPAQPYLSTVAKLKLVDGRLSTEGHIRYNAKEVGYQGSFALNNLRLNEAESGNLFLAWKSLGSREFKVTPKKLDIGELALLGLDTQLIINKDKTLSFTRLLKQPVSDASTKPAAPPVASTALAPAHPFLVNIDRFRIKGSEMDFADYSLALPFGTRIHDLKGIVTGISSQPGTPGQLELDGQVDDYGLARAVGQIDFLNPTDSMDLKVVFRNVEMTRLTPYSATFAGRKIASGKLSLDLQYKIHQRQLQGENQVVMDKLVLGERVESPEAKNLPLDLAIAILQDSDGRIDLGLPVSGSLDDPHFSYGGIIWKAIVNVLTKIATAPFRALGALFGGGEKFENIVFEAGSSHLTPPEREKLVRLAGALTKRPNLSIEIHGVYAEADRVAFQDRQLRRTVLEKSGQHIEGDGDSGPISTRQPKIQSALENIFSDRFGSGELAALKEGFRKANPGQLEESNTGKVMSRLSGLFHEKRKLNEPEITQMKGADFYAVLFARLLDKVIVDNERLLALATARGEYTATALKTAGAPTERLAVMASEKIETEGRDVPIKLVLGTTAKPIPPTSTGVTTN
jgi:uncharacterized protein involved in outer membrane biogenesis